MRFLVVIIILLQLKNKYARKSSSNILDGDSFYMNVDDFISPYKVNLSRTVGIKDAIDLRIINGEDADEFEFPYQAAVYITTGSRNSFCGGSVISNKYVLSAAHCFRDRTKRMIVVLGNDNLKHPSKYEKRIDAIRFVRHADFGSKTLKNDICLLELKHEVKFNDAIQPISLPGGYVSDYIGKVGIVSGHGSTYDGGNVVSQLMYTYVKVIDKYMCREDIYKKPVTSKHICTVGMDQESACHGDSGGPFVINKKLIGIVSFGRTKCTYGYPNVYTNVAQYVDWISHNSDI